MTTETTINAQTDIQTTAQTETNNTEKKMSQKERVQEIRNQLVQGVKDLQTSDDFKAYLAARSKFHDYSLNNRILILSQRPDASYVAGYDAWQRRFDRHVKPGSKGIQILQPTTWKKKVQVEMKDKTGKTYISSDGTPLTEEAEVTVKSFKVGYVFAYEDTEGVPLPEIVHTLDAPVNNFQDLMDILKSVSPVPIMVEPINSQANGYYSQDTKDIHIKEGMPELQTIKTTIHEIAHAVLHDKDTGSEKDVPKEEKEIVAEGTAFTVASYLGLPTQDYSMGYILGWSSGRDLKELQHGLDTIGNTADELIGKIEAEKLDRAMRQTNELAYKNGSNYFIINRADNGYEYQAYDKDFVKTSSAFLKSEEPRIDKAAEVCMNYAKMNPTYATSYNVVSLRAKVIERQTVKLVNEAENAMIVAEQPKMTQRHHM